jgi:uncharacterized protein involved in exopolysaccharide biosynthesis
MTRPNQTKAMTTGREEPDLLDYAMIGDLVGFVLRSAMRHKMWFIVSFLAVLGASAALLQVLPKQYQVQATVLAQSNPMMGTLNNPFINRGGDAPARSAREVVMRRDNLINLLKQTNFVERHLASRAPIANAKDWVLEKLGRKPSSGQLYELFADALAIRLWVVVGQEGTVTIAFVWTNPELAYEIVETAVQSYLEARHAAEINIIGESIAILEEHDAAVQKEAKALSTVLSAKEREHRRRAVVKAPEGAGTPQQVRVDEDLPRLEAKLAARQRAFQDLEEFRRRRIDDLQAQLAQQTTIYAPQHPTLMATRRSIESLSGPSPQIEQIRAEVLDLELEVKRRGGATSTQAVPGAASALLELEEARVRLDDSNPALDYERTQFRTLLRKHANLLDRIDAARMEMDTAQAAFKYRYSVINPPQFPRTPMRPYGLIFLGSGLLGGLAFGLLTTTLVDLRGGKIVERWQVERQLKLPVLAETQPEA